MQSDYCLSHSPVTFSRVLDGIAMHSAAQLCQMRLRMPNPLQELTDAGKLPCRQLLLCMRKQCSGWGAKRCISYMWRFCRKCGRGMQLPCLTQDPLLMCSVVFIRELLKKVPLPLDHKLFGIMLARVCIVSCSCCGHASWGPCKGLACVQLRQPGSALPGTLSPAEGSACCLCKACWASFFQQASLAVPLKPCLDHSVHRQSACLPSREAMC